MSIIIRLQNLPWEANSLDIRRFFQGLSIPDGGVHIVGGEKGDAFIAFTNDEDARQAMAKDGQKLKESALKLLLSSRNEMQGVIELARSQSLALKNQAAKQVTPIVAQTNRPVIPPTLPKNGHSLDTTPGLNGNFERGLHADRRPHQRHDTMVQNRNKRERSRSPINRPPMAGVLSMNDRTPLPLNNNHQNQQHWQNRAVNNFPRPPALMNPQYNSSIPPSQNNSLPPMANNLLPIGRPPLLPPGLPVSNRRAEIRGLPQSVSVRDLQEFLKTVNLYLPEENVKILVNEQGYKTGGAVISLASESELGAALSANGLFMGDTPISVAPLLDNVMRDTNLTIARDAILPTKVLPISEPVPQRDYVVYMKGIPFNSCTERDVAHFFQGLRITELVFEIDIRTGKPAGNAYVELGSKEDYDGALALHMRHMGRRYIEVFPTTREDLNEARIKAGGGKLGGEIRQTFCIHVTGLPPTINNRDLQSYFKEVNALPFAIHIMLMKNGVNAGEAFIEFLDPEHQIQAIRRDGDIIANHRISVRSVEYDFMASIVGKTTPPPLPPLNFGNMPRPGHPHHNDMNQRDRGRDRPQFEDRRRRSPVQRRGDGSDPFGDARCLVIVSNIPYKATNEDLTEFFHGFSTLQNGIERRVNDRGQSTPEARVAFTSPDEADAAVRAMHKKTLLGRPLFLRHAI